MKKEKKGDFDDLNLSLEDEFMDQFVTDVLCFENLINDPNTTMPVLRDAMIAQAICIIMYKKDIKKLTSSSPEIVKSYKSFEGPYEVSSEMLHEAYLDATGNLIDYMDIRRMGKH